MADSVYRTTLHNLTSLSNDLAYLTSTLNKKHGNRVASSALLTCSATDCFRLGEPGTIRPRLPVEILDAICFCLPPHHIKPLLFVNSFMSSLARRRLYHTVSLLNPRNIVQFMKTLISKPELATLVRVLDFHLNLAHPTSNLYSLLQRTLRLTTGLNSLSLELPKSQSPLWIFDSCTFKLKQFTTTMYCRRPLALFLESQSSIVDLTLRGYQADTLFFLPFVDPMPSSLQVHPSETFVLSPESLPHLKSFNAVHADACVIQAVVQGRPVQVVSIPLFPEMGIPTLDALQLSTASLKRLSVISFDPSAPSFLFEALSTRFEELEALHVVMLMAEYDNDMLERAANFIMNFKCLKYITFMAASTTTGPQGPDDDNSSNIVVEEDEGRIAETWHRACPTLRTIILPKGKVWFQSAQSNAAQLDRARISSGPSSSAVNIGTEVVAGDVDSRRPSQEELQMSNRQGRWTQL